MRTTIIGSSGSGKSELYAALTRLHTNKASLRAIVNVPEPRLEPLIALYHPKKITYSKIEYMDIPSGSKARGLSKYVLNEIQSADCLLAMLDNFSELADPKVQQATIETDLIINDLTIVTKRLERIALDKSKHRNKPDPQEEEALQTAQAVLELEQPLRDDPILVNYPFMRSFRFLSAKPILYAWNCAEYNLTAFTPPSDASSNNLAHIKIAARFERELAELNNLAERELFLADLDLTASALDRIITKTYALLGLITFFTVGDKEIRAWTIRRGTTALKSAGTIHSDLQKGFIRAEVLSWTDFLKVNSYNKAKLLGLVRLESKNYMVTDGDIIEFRFNV